MPLTALTADDTGLLKEVSLAPESSVVRRWGQQACGRGVSRACWGPGAEETHVGVGLEDGTVRFWRRSASTVAIAEESEDASPPSVDFAAGEEIGKGVAPHGGGPNGIAGLFAHGEAAPRVVAGERTGRVRVWVWPDGSAAHGPQGEPLATIETGKAAAVCRSAAGGEGVAVGGKGADPSVWSLEAGKAVWRARNLPNDELDLAVPIWLTDLKVAEGGRLLATGHGFVASRFDQAPPPPVYTHHTILPPTTPHLRHTSPEHHTTPHDFLSLHLKAVSRPVCTTRGPSSTVQDPSRSLILLGTFP